MSEGRGPRSASGTARVFYLELAALGIDVSSGTEPELGLFRGDGSLDAPAEGEQVGAAGGLEEPVGPRDLAVVKAEGRA